MKAARQAIDPFAAETQDLDQRLRLKVMQIKAEANGKVCGECTHYMGNWCALVVSHLGEELQISTPHAVACR